MEYRIEKDTMGKVQVPAHVYWGAQTQRSIENFPIAQDINKMPKEIIAAFAYLKKAAALTNTELGVLDAKKCDAIADVCDEILTGSLNDAFPLVVWQTGSGTQSNMNVNEVIANRAHEIDGKIIGEGNPTIKANDDAIFLLLSGEPIDEPIAQYGPFLMNTMEEVQEAIRDVHAGKFGVLED